MNPEKLFQPSLWLKAIYRFLQLESTPVDIEPNPYLSARRHWNEHCAAERAGRQLWQIVGLLSLLIALASVSGVLYFAGRSRFIPYIIEVDKHGEAIAVKPALVATTADPRVIHASLARFINNLRLVTPDVALQRQAIYQAYAMLSSGDPATNKANDWLNASQDSNPFRRAEKETVQVEITSALPQTADTWQIDWVETVRDRQGHLRQLPVRMRALLMIYIVQPTANTEEEQIRRNPLGIYIRDFSWSRQV